MQHVQYAYLQRGREITGLTKPRWRGPPPPPLAVKFRGADPDKPPRRRPRGSRRRSVICMYSEDQSVCKDTYICEWIRNRERRRGITSHCWRCNSSISLRSSSSVFSTTPPPPPPLLPIPIELNLSLSLTVPSFARERKPLTLSPLPSRETLFHSQWRQFTPRLGIINFAKFKQSQFDINFKFDKFQL